MLTQGGHTPEELGSLGGKKRSQGKPEDFWSVGKNKEASGLGYEASSKVLYL